LVEQETLNLLVVGSSPSAGTNFPLPFAFCGEYGDVGDRSAFTMLKFFYRLLNYILCLVMIVFGTLLAYEWLVPWYCDAFGFPCEYDSLYKSNNKTLPNPVIDRK
jgi:hypothetical protein